MDSEVALETHIIPVCGFDEALVQAMCMEMLGQGAGAEEVVSASTVRHLGHGVRATGAPAVLREFSGGDTDVAIHMLVALRAPLTASHLFRRHMQPALMRVQDALLDVSVEGVNT